MVVPPLQKKRQSNTQTGTALALGSGMYYMFILLNNWQKVQHFTAFHVLFAHIHGLVPLLPLFLQYNPLREDRVGDGPCQKCSCILRYSETFRSSGSTHRSSYLPFHFPPPVTLQPWPVPFAWASQWNKLLFTVQTSLPNFRKEAAHHHP